MRLTATLRQFSNIGKPKFELTLAILKPDLCRNPDHTLAVKTIILNNGFYFIRSKSTHLSPFDAQKFYEEHKEKFFFTRLVTFMSSGPISVHILAKENAIRDWRRLQGPTKVYKAQHEEPDSIRGRYGLTDTRNATHGSDSPVSALREIGFFFPEFRSEQWLKEEEPLFREGKQIEFDSEEWVHRIKPIVTEQLFSQSIWLRK
ncbi:hypothetical protein B4U79_05330 [Dinothrombium tinctorium]|uniref:Nucleoside diphosphate kinase n=1 Tax=Dinothrombium tinctorium TaxID=1965070 RepID=A0A3S3P6B0_9ACAR|nr:hypothetical protein B4U79_05330 [Dinothrombium tinctorium]